MSMIDVCDYYINNSQFQVYDLFLTQNVIDDEQMMLIDYLVSKLNDCMKDGKKFTDPLTRFLGRGSNGVVFRQTVQPDNKPVAIKFEYVELNGNSEEWRQDPKVKTLSKIIELQMNLGQRGISLNPIAIKQMLILKSGKTNLSNNPGNYANIIMGLMNIIVTDIADMDGDHIFKGIMRDKNKEQTIKDNELIKYTDMMLNKIKQLIQYSSCLDLKLANFLYIKSTDSLYVSDIDVDFCTPFVSDDKNGGEMYKSIQMLVFLFNVLRLMIGYQITSTMLIVSILNTDQLKYLYNDLLNGGDIFVSVYNDSTVKMVVDHYALMWLKPNEKNINFSLFKQWFIQIFEKPSEAHLDYVSYNYTPQKPNIIYSPKGKHFQYETDLPTPEYKPINQKKLNQEKLKDALSWFNAKLKR